MVSTPTNGSRVRVDAKHNKIQHVGKRIDDTDRAILVNIIVRMLGQQHRLLAVLTFEKLRREHPPHTEYGIHPIIRIAVMGGHTASPQ